jgi:hypothetical protein
MRKPGIVLCLLTMCIVATMQAQTPTGTVSGIVKDSRGALIQGATVPFMSTAQRTAHESITNSSVLYSIPDPLDALISVDRTLA